MISIVIPAYNEEKSITTVINELKERYKDYEIIVIDDGSSDKTFELANKTGIRVLRHFSNKGYGAALKTGIRNASSDIVLFFDADAQHNYDDVSKIIGAMDRFDMVVGARTKQSYRSYLRDSGKEFLSIIANYLAKTNIPDLNSGLRAIKKDVVVRFMHILPDTFSLTTTITLALLKGGYKVHYIPIITTKRLGKSSVKIKDGFRTILLILRIIMLFDPLRVCFHLSIALLGISFFLGLFALIRQHEIWRLSITAIFLGTIVLLAGFILDRMLSIKKSL